MCFGELRANASKAVMQEVDVTAEVVEQMADQDISSNSEDSSSDSHVDASAPSATADMSDVAHDGVGSEDDGDLLML